MSKVIKSRKGDGNMKLEIFRNAEFGEVRTIVGEDGEPWFMLADVCRVLEIKNSRQAKTRLNVKGVISNDATLIYGYSSDGTPKYRKSEATFINEPNLYKLVFQSRKPQAERFADWVTGEVLPSIRKHGAYITKELLADKEKLENAIEKIQEDYITEKLELETKLLNVREELQDTAIDLDVAYDRLESSRVCIEEKDLLIQEQLRKIQELEENKYTEVKYYSTTQLGDQYNFDAAFLNRLLRDIGIQHKEGNRWIIEPQFQMYGRYIHKYNRFTGAFEYTWWVWNEEGREFLDKVLRMHHCIPKEFEKVVDK